MVRVYSRENATQRGNNGTAQAGSVAAAVRFIVKKVFGGVSGEFTGHSASVVRGQIGSEKGVGVDVVVRFLHGVPGINESTVKQALANLKASGHYTRIIEPSYQAARPFALGRRSLPRRRLVGSVVVVGSGAGLGFGSGLGSLAASRTMPGWSSSPEPWQTMQTRSLPGRIGPWWGHFDSRVNAPIGKVGLILHHGRTGRDGAASAFAARDARSRASLIPACTVRTETPATSAMVATVQPISNRLSQSPCL